MSKAQVLGKLTVVDKRWTLSLAWRNVGSTGVDLNFTVLCTTLEIVSRQLPALYEHVYIYIYTNMEEGSDKQFQQDTHFNALTDYKLYSHFSTCITTSTDTHLSLHRFPSFGRVWNSGPRSHSLYVWCMYVPKWAVSTYSNWAVMNMCLGSVHCNSLI